MHLAEHTVPFREGTERSCGPDPQGMGRENALLKAAMPMSTHSVQHCAEHLTCMCSKRSDFPVGGGDCHLPGGVRAPGRQGLCFAPGCIPCLPRCPISVYCRSVSAPFSAEEETEVCLPGARRWPDPHSPRGFRDSHSRPLLTVKS